jgi:hypothetical protein
MKILFIFGEAIPFGIRLLDDDLSLLQKPLQGLVDVEFNAQLLGRPQGEVFEVDKNGQGFFILVGGYSPPIVIYFPADSSPSLKMYR